MIEQGSLNHTYIACVCVRALMEDAPTKPAMHVVCVYVCMRPQLRLIKIKINVEL
jgi:hypothetical protein